MKSVEIRWGDSASDPWQPRKMGGLAEMGPPRAMRKRRIYWRMDRVNTLGALNAYQEVVRRHLYDFGNLKTENMRRLIDLRKIANAPFAVF